MTTFPLSSAGHFVKFSFTDSKLLVRQQERYSSLSVLTAIFQVDLGWPVPECLHSGILLRVTMTEVMVTTGAIRRAKLQSNHHHQQTNTQRFYRPDVLPVAQPTVSEHWREYRKDIWPIKTCAHKSQKLSLRDISETETDIAGGPGLSDTRMSTFQIFIGPKGSGGDN